MRAEYLSVIVVLVGFYGMIVKDNIIKKIIGMNVMTSGAILYIIVLGYRKGATAPVMEEGIEHIVNPIPHALMLTAIVIGICLTAFALAISLKLYIAFGHLEYSRIESKLQEDE